MSSLAVLKTQELIVLHIMICGIFETHQSDVTDHDILNVKET